MATPLSAITPPMPTPKRPISRCNPGRARRRAGHSCSGSRTANAMAVVKWIAVQVG
jgi:hypothetical protein